MFVFLRRLRRTEDFRGVKFCVGGGGGGADAETDLRRFLRVDTRLVEGRRATDLRERERARERRRGVSSVSRREGLTDFLFLRLELFRLIEFRPLLDRLLCLEIDFLGISFFLNSVYQIKKNNGIQKSEF